MGQPYVGYAYREGLTNGISDTEFGMGTVDSAMYVTFALRALGYDDSKGDFVWNDPYILAQRIGLAENGQYHDHNEFLRGDAPIVSILALSVRPKGDSQVLGVKLTKSGVFTEDDFDKHGTIDIPLSHSQRANRVIDSVTQSIGGYTTLETVEGGAFEDGQDSKLVLSSYGYDKSGGAKLFNHPNGIATDGERFYVCDTWNHRVLVYNTAPDENSVPDIVLGQKDFDSAGVGCGLDQMNWPIGVATDGTHLYVTDTRNHRVLVWNTLPMENGQAADFVLNLYERKDNGKKDLILWPWAVWTNGEKLIVTGTTAGTLLIWNTLPNSERDMPDIAIEGLGTVRTIVTDGESYLICGDHNIEENGRIFEGTRVWTSFPANSNDKQDFIIPEKQMGGGELSDGRIVLMTGVEMYVYDGKPTNANWSPAYTVGGGAYEPDDDDRYYFFNAGDYTQVLDIGGKLYVSCYNGSKIVVFDKIPDNPHSMPTTVIGAADRNEDVLVKTDIFQNLNPDTDGKALIASDDFNQNLYIWKQLPGESAAMPDYIFNLWQFTPTDCCLYDGTVLAAGYGGGVAKVAIWDSLISGDTKPDHCFTGRVGTVTLTVGAAIGIARDDKYFYISDSGVHKTYVFDGIPEENDSPVYTLDHGGVINAGGGRLAVADSSVWIYEVDKLDRGESNVVNIGEAYVSVIRRGSIVKEKRNLSVFEALVGSEGELILIDSQWNQALYWSSVSDAAAEKKPTVLGFSDENYTNLTLGTLDYDKDTVHNTGRSSVACIARLAYDGQNLWVTEMKFSSRMLLFAKK